MEGNHSQSTTEHDLKWGINRKTHSKLDGWRILQYHSTVTGTWTLFITSPEPVEARTRLEVREVDLTRLLTGLGHGKEFWVDTRLGPVYFESLEGNSWDLMVGMLVIRVPAAVLKLIQAPSCPEDKAILSQ